MIKQITLTDGEHLHVNIIGDGQPVLFLHGWTSNHREWLPYAEPLSETFQCFCWDARAHGGHTLVTETRPTVQRMAQDLRDLLEHFDLHNVAILGHSMGALTTWEYIRQFGCERLSRLCLVDQSPRLLTDDVWQHGIYGDFSHDQNAAFIQKLEEDFAEAVLHLAAYGLNHRARDGYEKNGQGIQRVREYLQKLQPEPLIEIWKSLTKADYRDVLLNISVPTLLVHGDESHFYSVELANYVAQTIPEAQLHIYEATDHSPHQWQRDRFINDLRNFLLAESA